jgi:hypothetical protein
MRIMNQSVGVNSIHMMAPPRLFADP